MLASLICGGQDHTQHVRKIAVRHTYKRAHTRTLVKQELIYHKLKQISRIKKNEGKFTGWLAYTLSKSEQRTPGRNENEVGINLGQWYNTPYDKTHDISINASYELNDRWRFGGNLIFQTGQPTNFPVGQFEFQGITIPTYGFRNEQRLTDFHRLDVSATFTPKKNKNRKYKKKNS